MTELIRPILYGADHPVQLVTPGAAVDGVLDLAGPICEAGDSSCVTSLGGSRRGAGGRWRGRAAGDRSAGAYGAAMASNYNGRLVLRRPCSRAASCGSAGAAKRSRICWRATPRTERGLMKDFEPLIGEWHGEAMSRSSRR